MMNTNQPYEFTVNKKSFTFTTCPKCDGSGVVKRTFRSMTFVEDCSNCEGTGRMTNAVNKEVNLVDALKELSIIK